MIAFRPEASVIYINADSISDAVLERIRDEGGAARLVICELSASPYLDLAGAQMLHKLHGYLASLGTPLRIVGAHGSVRNLCELMAIVGDNSVGDKSTFVYEVPEPITAARRFTD